MRTRQKERDSPGPSAPWNEIVAGLRMGGHYWTPPGGDLELAVMGDEFEVVVSLFTLPGHGPAPHVEHIVRAVPDDVLSAAQIRAVQDAVQFTAESVRRGRRTLVRCHSGYNRSGLVVAGALTLLGHGTDRVIRLIRERRSPWALNNPVFVEYLNTGLDVALLLSGLDESAIRRNVRGLQPVRCRGRSRSARRSS